MKGKLIVAAIILIPVVGVAFKADIGTLCSLCPLGALQLSLASKSLTPGIGFALVFFAAVVLLGRRFFCTTLCPTKLIGKKSLSFRGKPLFSSDATRRARISPPYQALLVGSVLLTSFVVGFPLFCLFCPLGLMFGFAFSLTSLFITYEPSWNLIVFPAILLLEFKVLRGWCSRLCPLGALFHLVGRKKKPYPTASAQPEHAVCSSCAKTCGKGGFAPGDTEVSPDTDTPAPCQQ